MLSNVLSATVLGVHGQPVTVEVHIGQGLPGFTILGRPDEVCREARDRVRAAFVSSGLDWPARRITMNLAPSDVRKVGSSLDLAIAVAVLVADEKVPAASVANTAFVGELGLDGSLRAVVGAAPMIAVRRDVDVVVPADNWAEASIVRPRSVRIVSSLREVVECLKGERAWTCPDATCHFDQTAVVVPDLADVRGQETARLGLELAASGGHHLLLIGPPGSGKTMLAQRLPGLLPRLDDDTSLAATMIRSAAGESLPAGGLVTVPPIRMPHHSLSHIAMVGGGSGVLRPGEISLAHGGVLFLDELGEFAPSTLDALRQPLEEGVVRLSRANATATLPARFTLVGATNPCPCGGGPPGSCSCDDAALSRYRRRFSGPLLDRFDLRVVVHPPEADELLGRFAGESTAEVVVRVRAARERAIERQGRLNAELDASSIDLHAPLSEAARRLLRDNVERGRLSGRGLLRVRRVARSLADIAGHDGELGDHHVAAALALRSHIGVRPRP
ncbi:MAG: YifB family Mg chelatase-like AAA ATPase [Ilumatobacteraceae bacterium]